MSGSFHQLYLLLWRNVLIRWRGGHVTIRKKVTIPLFQLLEILWPLLLYLIIVSLRQYFPPNNALDSKYRAFALPSAGTLPFIQTLLCDAGSEEDIYPFSDMPAYPNAKVNGLYSVLDDVGDFNATWTELCDSLHDLAEQGDCLNEYSTKARDGCYTASQDKVPLTCYLKNSTAFREYLSSNLSLSQPVVDGILGATLNLTEVPSFSQFLGGGRGKRQVDSSLPFLLQNLGSLKPVLCNSDQWHRFIQFDNISAERVKNELCQLSDSEWQNLSQEVQQQVASDCSPVEVSQRISQVLDVQKLLRKTDLFDELSDGSGFGDDDMNDGSGSGDEEAGGNSMDSYFQFFCGDVKASPLRSLGLFLPQAGDVDENGTYDGVMNETINETNNTEQIAFKILYTPLTNVTKAVIENANRTFETAGQVLALAQQVSDCSQFFLDQFPPESLEGERVILDQLIAYRTSGEVVPGAIDVTLLFPNVSLDDLQTARDLINNSAPNSIWKIMETAHDVSEDIIKALSQFDWDVFYPVESESAMEQLAGNSTQQEEYNITYIAAGIVFESNMTDSSSLKRGLLKIRTNFSAVVDPSEYKETIWFPGPENEHWKKRYIELFFIFIQDILEHGMMEEIVGHRISSPGVYIQEMPYPCYKEDPFTVSLLYVLPLAMLFAWLFPVAMTARAVVREKEVRLKEFMKMMGVSEGILRLSWFIHSFGVLLVTVVFITLLLKLGGVLPATNGLILFLYLALYAVVMLSYSFLVSAFFNNANLAACVASLIYFLVFFAHVTIVPNMNSLSPVVIGVCCLWAPLAFALGATYLVQWELQQIGLQWSNIAIPPIEDDHLSFLSLTLIMALDSVIYFVLTWYIEGVFPGRYGVSKPWYFPFMPSYWCGQRRVLSRSGRKGHMPLQEEGEETIGLRGSAEDEERLENCEEEPDGLTLGISIHNLTKKFSTGFIPGRKKKVLAVNNLSLNFYQNQITAFLGHNGAGKTTTMSILTGLFEPSSGTACIYGSDIQEDMDTIRQSLGICPQHNILFDELTVEEHLLFYGQLKGLSFFEAKEQVPVWLRKVNLFAHAHKYSKHLSGGVKRKLSILLAFVGKSKTIILDEPTSGVDPFARRQIWDFLSKHRDNRTIMLSTHHMDEAEILGDRIAIISSGSLLCCGSFEYLKHRFGRGHRLTLVSKVHGDRRASISSRTFTVTADVEEEDHPPLSMSSDMIIPEDSSPQTIEMEITKFLQGLIVGATLIERRGRELHYLLPLLQARPRQLANLFSELEQSKDVLGVASYGMTSCSMEEIFVQLTEQELSSKAESDTPDSFAPRPTLSSVDSQTSLDPPTTTQHSSGEEDDKEGLLDEDGLLFGDQSCDDPLGSGLVDTNNRHTYFHLWILQFYALLVKRVLYTKGALVALAVQNLFPLVVIILALTIARFLQFVPDPPELELSPHLFFAKSQYNYMFVGGNYSNGTSPMIDSLFRPCGIAASDAAHCYHSNNLSTAPPQQCPVDDYPQNQYSFSCPQFCSNGSETNYTLFNSSDLPSCYNGTVTGSRVLNVTTHDDDDDVGSSFYYLHDYLLRSTNSFIEQRYGGLSFGHSKQEVDAGVDVSNSDPSTTLPFLATHSAAKAWYSLKGYHAMPAYLNAMNNAILRSHLVNVSQDSLWEYGIRTKSSPFKMTLLEKLIYPVKENASFLVNPLAAIFSLGFVVAGFVLLLIEERSCNIKHLQVVCGMNTFVYWLSAYIWDMVWYTCFVVVMVLFYVAFKDPYYTSSSKDMFLFFILLLCYGFSCGPWMYVGSFFFKSPATAYILLFCLNFFSGFSLLIVDAIVVQLEDHEGSSFLHYTLVWVPFPSYTLARSMMYFTLDQPVELVANTLSKAPLSDPFSKLSPFIVSMLVQGCVYTILIVVVELFPLITSKIIQYRSLSLPAPIDEDNEVANERKRVLKTEATKELLILRNLSKVYGTKFSSQYRLAVNQLCLKMKKAECFGLLGVNGAGKTTTFRMLTGDTRVTSGEACINSQSVSSGGGGGAKSSVGYCPQVDALMPTLTGRQHLTFYCRLRGLPSSKIVKVVEWALVKLGLSEYADKPAGVYSGGNRRKLSTAIALLARPPLILLDEPTSGVDPRARQFLWSIVKDVVSAGQSVLLTTHSMAECEALCSRVGIMVNGSFCCLGSIQQLKMAYGEGYRLKIRVSAQVEELKDFIRQNISNATLKEDHYGALIYQLPSEGLHLPDIYETMELARETLDIKDYSLSQTSLDDVFIHFANQQSEDAGLQLNQDVLSTVQFSTLLAQEDLEASTVLELPDIIADIESHA